METTIYGMFGQYAELALAIVGVCAAIAALLPAPKDGDGKWYQWLYKVMNLLAANVKHARNATAPTSDGKRD